MVRSTSMTKGGGRRTTNGHTKQYVPQNTLEKMRAAQLIVCLALFFAVFIGKGVFPERMVQIQNDIRYLMSSDMDLRGSLEALGLSFVGENETISELGAFCVEVFGMETAMDHNAPEKEQMPEMENLLETEIQRLGTDVSMENMSDYYLESAYTNLSLTRVKTEVAEAIEDEVPETVPVAGTVIMEVNYTGRALPENYTMDQLSFGELETTTPVLGHLNSEYGYRDHPINGVYQFHGGVDIGGQKGDPIAAFADGRVEYIGEDKSYGLYLQIDHGNGVKSFYAHCNKLMVSKGDIVAAGETIAQVGSSGAATGPHLHLELKWNNTRVNPAYYLDFLTV